MKSRLILVTGSLLFVLGFGSGLGYLANATAKVSTPTEIVVDINEVSKEEPTMETRVFTTINMPEILVSVKVVKKQTPKHQKIIPDFDEDGKHMMVVNSIPVDVKPLAIDNSINFPVKLIDNPQMDIALHTSSL